jgi:hypothetical protein
MQRLVTVKILEAEQVLSGQIVLSEHLHFVRLIREPAPSSPENCYGSPQKVNAKGEKCDEVK